MPSPLFGSPCAESERHVVPSFGEGGTCLLREDSDESTPVAASCGEAGIAGGAMAIEEALTDKLVSQPCADEKAARRGRGNNILSVLVKTLESEYSLYFSASVTDDLPREDVHGSAFVIVLGETWWQDTEAVPCACAFSFILHWCLLFASMGVSWRYSLPRRHVLCQSCPYLTQRLSLTMLRNKAVLTVKRPWQNVWEFGVNV